MNSTKIVDKTSTNLEARAEKFLLKLFSKVEQDVDTLDSLIVSNQGLHPQKLAVLINAKQRAVKSGIYLISMIRDPKLSGTTQSARLKDLANLIAAVQAEDEKTTGTGSDELGEEAISTSNEAPTCNVASIHGEAERAQASHDATERNAQEKA